MNSFFHHFLHLLAESVPLFLLGAAIGAALEVWLPRGWVERWLSSGKSSVFLATSAGALLPGCAMSTMPLAASLKARGTPLGTVAAFIMIAPVLSPHTIVMTASLISLPMAVARVVLSFAVAWMLGLMLNAAGKKLDSNLTPIINPETISDPESSEERCCSSGETCKTKLAPKTGWRLWLSRFGSNLRELLPFLIGGLAVAAAVLAFFPIENYQQYIRSGWAAYLITALIAIPTYVCDGGEIPLTRALLELGVGPGPAFCFMMASVGTCFPTIAMANRIIGWRATLIYLAAWIVLAIGGGLLVEAWLTPHS